MTQILLNLVRNALEAMPTPGRVILSLGQDDKTVSITVRDHGPGIKPEAIEGLFQPFFTTKERGTGLGLPVVQAIVNNHGGQIKCCNVPDGGAQFHIELMPYQSSDGETINVDIVLAANNRILENALRNADFSLIVINNVEEFESLSSRYQPAVIIMDSSRYHQYISKSNEIWPDTPIIIWRASHQQYNPQVLNHFTTNDYIKLITKLEEIKHH